MAGVVPKRSTSGRKQWTIHDGQKGSLKRLRSQLASDGCPESQVVLAKQLLDEQCELDVDKRENARLGVYWLIKASEQGNAEATELLKQCLDSGKGITEHNYLDVKSCITMTQDEKLARKAAREMFASLSNGGEYITSEQLQRRMLAIDREQKIDNSVEVHDVDDHGEHLNGELVNNYEEASSESDEEIDWRQRGEHNEKLTEDHLVSAAVNYSHGQLPIVNRILCLSHPNLRTLDHIPVIQRHILHPLLALKILYFTLIRFFGCQPIFAFLPVAKTDLQLVFLILVYTLVSTENILYFLPMGLYYLTFVVMIVTTFQMLQTKREFYDFRVWSGLFITYSGGSLNSEEAEFQFIRKNLKPYWLFFIALIINLMLYPIIVEQYIAQSELTVIGFCLTFMTLFGFMYKKRSKTIHDGLILFSFAINVLAKYPYETDPVVTQGWRFLDLKIPTFASYIIGNGIEFCINFRILLYAFIPVLFLKIANRKHWRGIYMFLIPHCVTLSWLQIVIISSQGATMFGLLRGTLALVGVVLFLPLVGLTTVFLPAAAITKCLVTSNFIYSFSTFLACGAIGLVLYSVLAKSTYRRYSAVFQVLFAAIAFYFLINSLIDNKIMSNEFYVEKPIHRTISYEHYQKYCHQHAWENENIASTQIRCSNLENLQIHWDGYIQDIKVTSITNKWRYFIDKLPTTLAQYLYCFYGEEIKSRCEFEELHEDCEIFYDAMKSNLKCSLDRFNVYSFEILVRMQSGIWGKSGDIVVVADHYFKNYTLALTPNDHVWFRGRLQNNLLAGADGILGGIRPHLKLEEIGCHACHNVELTEIKITMKTGYDFHKIINDLYLGIKCILNFLFNPIVVFK